MSLRHEIGGPDDEFEVIFRPWFRRPDGTVVYAKTYGKKVFPIRVRRRPNS